mmetsp:Transcript_14065/g.52769  ORF Transcript_14065/g.52769 Transcript_14065/m.52769 type:complete len:597 (+) Transcript_14065:785-2575(+)
MRNRDARLASHQLVERSLDALLALRIQRCRRLVEQEQLRLLDNGAGDREPLLLPAAEALRVGVQAARQALDIVPKLSGAQRGLHLLVSGSRGAPNHVLPDGGVEHHRLLGDDTDDRRQERRRVRSERPPVEQDAALRRVVESLEKVQHRALATAALAHEPDLAPGGNVQAEVSYHHLAVLALLARSRLQRLGVREPDVLELDLAPKLDVADSLEELDAGLSLEEDQHARAAGHPVVPVLVLALEELLDEPEHPPGEAVRHAEGGLQIHLLQQASTHEPTRVDYPDRPHDAPEEPDGRVHVLRHGTQEASLVLEEILAVHLQRVLLPIVQAHRLEVSHRLPGDVRGEGVLGDIGEVSEVVHKAVAESIELLREKALQNRIRQQLRAVVEHGREPAEEVPHGIDDIRELVREEVADGVRVVLENAEQRIRRVAIDVRNFALQQLGEDVGLQGEHKALRPATDQPPLEVLHDLGDANQHDRQARRPGELLHVQSLLAGQPHQPEMLAGQEDLDRIARDRDGRARDDEGQRTVQEARALRLAEENHLRRRHSPGEALHDGNDGGILLELDLLLIRWLGRRTGVQLVVQEPLHLPHQALLV